jgi:hypothetical protein
MNIKFIPTSTFEKSYKRLKKKYASLVDDLRIQENEYKSIIKAFLVEK